MASIISRPGLLHEATRRLRGAGVEQPAREARLLLAFAQHRPEGSLPDLSDRAPPGFAALVSRRAAREPMAFITGHQGFWDLDLAVSRDTLIPRADSETLIEASLAALPDRAAVSRILDLGTGTGALLLAGLRAFPASWGIGTDRLEGVCRLAAANARRNGLDRRCFIVCADWAHGVVGRFDLILCNPPYIRGTDLPGLMPEVAHYEPASALDGGADGLCAYRAIAPLLPALLTRHGVAILELGTGQTDDVADLLRAAGLAIRTVAHDLSGIARAVVAQKLFGDRP